MGIRRKTFWKRTFAVFLASACLWSAAGCAGAGTGVDREDEEVSTELTQRQRELLEEMGLPASVRGEKLDLKQFARLADLLGES